MEETGPSGIQDRRVKRCKRRLPVEEEEELVLEGDKEDEMVLEGDKEKMSWYWKGTRKRKGVIFKMKRTKRKWHRVRL